MSSPFGLIEESNNYVPRFTFIFYKEIIRIGVFVGRTAKKCKTKGKRQIKKKKRYNFHNNRSFIKIEQVHIRINQFISNENVFTVEQKNAYRKCHLTRAIIHTAIVSLLLRQAHGSRDSR